MTEAPLPVWGSCVVILTVHAHPEFTLRKMGAPQWWGLSRPCDTQPRPNLELNARLLTKSDTSNAFLRN
jgi:hypothetical protein